MKFIHQHRSASDLALKNFAITMSWGIPLFFTLLIPWLFNQPWQIWPFYISAYLLFAAFTWKKLLMPLYVIWMVVASIIGWINTRVILGIIFYIIMLPIGMFLRVSGKLQYQRKPSLQKSYWINREQPPQPDDLERPF